MDNDDGEPIPIEAFMVPRRPAKSRRGPAREFRPGELRSEEGIGTVLRDFTLAAAGGTTIPVGSPCWIEFAPDAVLIDASDYQERVPYKTIQALQVTGSSVKANAGLWGGGFGVTGAVEGILAAGVINALTTRTKRYAVLRIVTGSSEFIFSSHTRDGAELGLMLTPVQVQIRKAHGARKLQNQSQNAVATSIADELRKLADLRDDGILTEDEFSVAKARLLGRG
jgi:hypothetical protein